MINAKITKTYFGLMYGHLAWSIDFEHERGMQNTGAITVKGKEETIKSIIKLLDVRYFNELEGKICRIEQTDERIAKVIHPIKESFVSL